MSRRSNGLVAAAIVAGTAVMVSAQAPQQGREPSPTGANPQGSYIVTGCVERARGDGQAGAVGTSGTTPAAPAEFVLTEAVRTTSGSGTAPPGDRAGQGGSASGQGASPDSGGSASGAASYVLEGRSKELAGHVGHRVEVTGTMSSASAPSGANAAGAGGRSSGSPSSGAAAGVDARRGQGGGAGTGREAVANQAARRLQVTSVRMLAENCE